MINELRGLDRASTRGYPDRESTASEQAAFHGTSTLPSWLLRSR
jgi:hypothetical protein